MPARSKKRKPSGRRKKLVRHKKRDKSRFNYKLASVFAFLAIFFSLYFHFTSRFRQYEKRLSLAIKKEDGDVLVSTFDFEADNITNIVIPQNTEVEVARQLGIIQIKNVWQLGINEGLDGELLAETVTRYLRFPLIAWSDNLGKGFANGNLVELLKAVFLPYKTNLNIGDKVRIAIFSFRVQSTKRVDINLSDTSYISKRFLTGGEEGYIVTGKFPDELLIVFSDPEVAREGMAVVIKNASSNVGVAKDLGEIIEVLGAKVVSIDKEEISKAGCEISGKDKKVLSRVANILSCSLTDKSIEGTIDAEIKFGEEFAERF